MDWDEDDSNLDDIFLRDDTSDLNVSLNDSQTSEHDLSQSSFLSRNSVEFDEEEEEDQEIDWENGITEDLLDKPNEIYGEARSDDQNGRDIIISIDKSREDRRKNATKSKPKVKSPKKTIRWVRITKAAKEAFMNTHKAHILCLIAHHKILYSFKNNELAQALILSNLPMDLAAIKKKSSPKTSGSKKRKRQKRDFTTIQELVTIFHTVFTIYQREAFEIKKGENSIDAPRDNTLEKFIEEIQQATISAEFAPIVFAIICQFVGVFARYVFIIDPVCHIVAGSLDEHQSLDRETLRSSYQFPETQTLPVNSWVEIFDEEKDNWVSVEIQTNRINSRKYFEHLRLHLNKSLCLLGQTANVQKKDDDEEKESPKKKKKVEKPAIKEPRSVQCNHKGCIYYALGFYEDILFDVSWRYTTDWFHAIKNRIHDAAGIAWWEETLDSFISEKTDDDLLTRFTKSDKKLRDKLEKSIQIPTTVVGFQKHPLFLLEKNVAKYQTVFPDEPIDNFRGQKVYLRSHLYDLHSAEKWLEKGREVKPNEESIKIMDSIKNSSNKKEKPDPGKTALYGKWQTRVFLPKELSEDGKIPRNPYGNVYLFHAWMIPKGTVHLPYRTGICIYSHLSFKKFSHTNFYFTVPIARKLGIDVAPAMVGWKNSKGWRSVPNIEGVIVAIENAKMLTDAYRNYMIKLVKRQKIARRLKAATKWRKLVNRYMIYKQLSADAAKFHNEN